MKLRALVLFLLTAAAAHGAIHGGKITLTGADLQPGARTDLSGQWLYHPGEARAERRTDYVSADVPQFLNRVQWWLDDSEDFKRFESKRLSKLHFNTETNEEGWYRLQLDLPALPPQRHLWIEFDGVAMKCRVACNGHELGRHAGMFSRFSFDLTDFLKPGRNEISVFDSMEKIPSSSLAMGAAVTVNLTASKIRTLSKGMYGPLAAGADNREYDLHGIWQPVRLVARGPEKIEDVWFVPQLDSCAVRVKVSAASDNAVIEEKLTDAKSGEALAKDEVDASAGGDWINHSWKNLQPKLWTPSEPNLYNLEVTLKIAGQVSDQWTQKVGFRTFEIRGNQFYLNGHPWWLRGADHLPYGKNPWDPQLPRKLIKALHDANIMITRTHATPWNEAWLDAADEIGLGVSVEGIRPWALAGNIGATPPDMMAGWLMENKDVIERCRNHPSVLIYTVGNEMMLKDPHNMEKWKQLSDVVKQTRATDPTRPVICSSEYERDPRFYNDVLKPGGIDDGDIDDLHRYNNWYGPSSFVIDAKFASEMRRNGGRRPLMGQEMSTGYPDLDTGLPVLRYTRDLLTPQAWVGIDSYPGSNPAVFLEHDRAVTKRWAERMRFERGTNTAGFMLFAAECWFSHSYDSKTFKAYPTLDAMRQADAPVGLAWETGRRRFHAGERLSTSVFISDDDNQYRDFHNLTLEAVFPGEKPVKLARVDNLLYRQTVQIPVDVVFPKTSAARKNMLVRLRLMQDGVVIGETSDPMEIFSSAVPAPDLRQLAAESKTILVLPGQSLDGLAQGGPLRQQIENGATAVVLSPGADIVKLFPDAVRAIKSVVGEFADFYPVARTPLGAGLRAMDLKWWGRTNDWRTFAASQAQQLRPGGPARELIRYIPPHGYIPAEKVPDQYMCVMWELKLGRGRLWVCDLDLEQCDSVDPAAALFARNLFQAAGNPHSLDNFRPFPSHEELLKGRTDAK